MQHIFLIAVMEKQIQITPADLASHGKRIVNYIVDKMFCAFLVLGLSIVGAHLDKEYGITVLNVGLPTLHNLKFNLFQLGIEIIYFGLFESLNGRTLGKLITETRVVMRDGSKPENGPILLRTICRLIPFEFLSFIGAIPMGWHDILSKTVVVDNYAFNRAQQKANTLTDNENINSNE